MTKYRAIDNVLLDDKAGFEVTDWLDVVDAITEYRVGFNTEPMKVTVERCNSDGYYLTLPSKTVVFIKSDALDEYFRTNE